MFLITRKKVLPTEELVGEELNEQELSQVVGGASHCGSWHHHYHHHWHHHYHHHHGHWDWEKEWKLVWVKVWDPCDCD